MFYRTRSLVAVTIAHALVNVPARGVADFVRPILMLAIVIAFRKPVLAEARRFWSIVNSETSSRAITALGCLGGVFFMIVFALSQEAAVLAGVALLSVALVMETIEKRRLRSAAARLDGLSESTWLLRWRFGRAENAALPSWISLAWSAKE